MTTCFYFFLALFLLSLLAAFAELVRFWRCWLPLGNVRKAVSPTPRSCRRIRRAQLASCCAVPDLARLLNKHPAWFRAVPQSIAEIYVQSRPSCPCYVHRGRGPPLETSKALLPFRLHEPPFFFVRNPRSALDARTVTCSEISPDYRVA